MLLALLTVNCHCKEENNSNEVSVSPPSVTLNVNFRKALLKALIELENEDNKNNLEEDSEKVVEKASASALSVYTSSEVAPRTSTTPRPATEKPKDSSPLILFQKSQAVEQSPITTFEREDLDPFNDAEQILTSASNSFTVPDKNSLRSDSESRSISKGVLNLIKYDKPTTTQYNKGESTTAVPSSSTEESEAKAEEVQFFSAPLVAAFTVHQDEQGIPMKVESIFKTGQKKQEEELQRNRPEEVQQVDQQLELQQKQKILEQEIFRLNLNLKQQQFLNQQQQELFLRQQQEQLRFRSNDQPFLPIVNPTLIQFSTEKPSVNPVIQFGQSLPTKPAQPFNTEAINSNSGVTLLSSVAYDPLLEAGKLPLNAQILPVKGAINFHTPIIQTAAFQQFHSVPQATPVVGTLNQLRIGQPQFTVSTPQGNRVFRQEVGIGNHLNTDFNRGASSISIQKSVQPPNLLQVNPSFVQSFNMAQPQQGNRIFRSSLESTLTAPQQNYRFFRSNPESTFRSANSFNRPQSNNQLSNLLYNSEAFRDKVPEDINIISKVLTLNHSGGNQYFPSNTFGGK